MAKASAKKPGGEKAGNELPYSSAEKVLGGPVCDKVNSGLGADYKFSGSKSMPTPKEGEKPSMGKAKKH